MLLLFERKFSIALGVDK